MTMPDKVPDIVIRVVDDQDLERRVFELERDRRQLWIWITILAVSQVGALLLMAAMGGGE